jgi:hypothetical protein
MQRRAGLHLSLGRWSRIRDSLEFSEAFSTIVSKCACVSLAVCSGVYEKWILRG